MMERNELIARIYEEATEMGNPIRFLHPSAIAFSHRFQTNKGMCFCIFDYLPYSRGKEADLEERLTRSIVFDFKEGRTSEICADLLAAAILSEPMLDTGPDSVLLHIPASTVEKNKKRFEVFSRLLAENLGITDGYPLLELVIDREPDDIRRGMPLSNIMLLTEAEELKDKNILVCDDVYTSGRSFELMSDYLMSFGARSVTGLFIAKTVENISY